MADDGFVIEGLQPLMERLKQLPANVQKGVLRTAIFRGSQAVRDIAVRNLEANGSVNTGDLRRSIKARRSRGTPTEVVAKVDVGEFYGRFVEKGFLHEEAGHIAAKPFLVPALKEAEKELVDIVLKGIEAELLKRFK